MADIIYLTLNGNKQGLISAGCSLDTPIYIRSPWELKKQLLDIYFPERGGIISGAY